MKRSIRKTVIVEIGAGLAAAGVAAGYYFYGSKTAKNHRKVVVKWASDMKKEVIAEAKRLKNESPRAFAMVVDRVAKTYQGARSVDVAEVKRAAKELKENWEIVQREMKRTVRKGISRARTTIKRAT